MSNETEWVLVPREPSEAMLSAAHYELADKPFSNNAERSARAYAAMLAAAPQPDTGNPVSPPAEAQPVGGGEVEAAAMTDIEMLPLPEHFAHQSERVQEHVRAYARAVAEHNVKALQAELDNRWAQGVHTCHDKCQRIACVLRRDNKRLAEALRECIALGHPRDPSIIAARAALRDHDQEGKDG